MNKKQLWDHVVGGGGVGGLGDGDSSENIPACLIVLTELGQKHFSSYSSALQLSFRRPRQSWSASAAMRGVPAVFRHSASWLMRLLSASAGSGRRFTVTDGVWGLQSSNNKRNENRPNAASPCADSLYDINKWSFSQKHIVYVWRDFFPPPLLDTTTKALEHQIHYVFHNGLRRMKTTTQKTARREKKKLRVH